MQTFRLTYAGYSVLLSVMVHQTPSFKQHSRLYLLVPIYRSRVDRTGGRKKPGMGVGCLIVVIYGMSGKGLSSEGMYTERIGRPKLIIYPSEPVTFVVCS